MSAEVIRFPRSMKRGPKVRRGPSAETVRFPAKGTELQAEWLWLSKSHNRWTDDKLPGPGDLASFDPVEFERYRGLEQMVRSALGCKPRTDAESGMRQDVAKWRAEIQKRVQVRDWLEKLGVDWNEAFEPERALFFAFDRLHASEQPASA